MKMTKEIKDFCIAHGADAVGVASPDRWKSAPVERSPLGLMANARAVIVCGFHYLDACVELSENDDVRIPGAANANHLASGHGMWLAFKLSKYLERAGQKAMPIPVTLWWNYRVSDSAARGYASDLTHYYAAVAAGLGEIGWSNICITPQYGPRLRFISVVTDAPLEADPLYGGEALCDRCMQCARKCPMRAFDLELDGMLTVDFGERQYSFPNKNLWRCAAGENFNLDVLADWPEKIDEAVVLEYGKRAALTDPSLRFGWKMGRCLKYCLPKSRRYYDRAYSPSPRRRRDVRADASEAGCARAAKALFALADRIGVDCLTILCKDSLDAAGARPETHLPGAKSALLVGQSRPPGAVGDAWRRAGRNALWLAKTLQEEHGFDCLVESGLTGEALAAAAGFDRGDCDWELYAVLTTLPALENSREYFYRNMLPCGAFSGISARGNAPLRRTRVTGESLNRMLREAAKEAGADMIGVSSASRLDAIDAQLARIFAARRYFYSYEKGWGPKSSLPFEMKARPTNPGIAVRELIPKRAGDYIKDAQSIVVIGLGLLDGSIENAGKPPANKAGHYAASTGQESLLQGAEIALTLAKILHMSGYRAAITDDLEDLASPLASTLQKNLTANRFPAIAAGLGELGENGLVLTPDRGARVRFTAIVTDAVLPCDALYMGEAICTGCGKCAKACPVHAISDRNFHRIEIEDRVFRWAETDLLRCDWAARYGLVSAEGPCYIGSTNDFPPPAEITPEALTDALRASDRIQTTEYCPIVERCFTECPANAGLVRVHE
jgi:epoxyqueuosine reductase QueG